jgi:hypothetical protein
MALQYKKTLITVLIIFLNLSSCQNKDAQFFKVTLLPENSGSPGQGYSIITEAYIISNPPSDTKALRNLVDNYFDKVPLPGSRYYDIERRFYRETKDTPRDYMERSFKYDTLDHHFEDEILIVDRVKDEYGEYVSYHFYKNGLGLENEGIYITLSRNPEN